MAERTVVTKVTNAVLYSDGSIRLDKVRFSHPHIGSPYEGDDNDDGKKDPRYGVIAMLPKSTHAAAKDLVKKVIQDIMTKEDTKVGVSFWCLADGDKLADEEGDKKELYRGHWIVRASEKRRPAARNAKGDIMDEKIRDDEFYGGMWGDVLIRLWYFNGKARNGKTYPKRMLANLIAVRKVRDDESFGEGRISDEGVFDTSDEGGDGLDGDDDL